MHILRKSKWTGIAKSLEADIVNYLGFRSRTFQDQKARELMNRLGTGWNDDVRKAEQDFGKEVKH